MVCLCVLLCIGVCFGDDDEVEETKGGGKGMVCVCVCLCVSVEAAEREMCGAHSVAPLQTQRHTHTGPCRAPTQTNCVGPPPCVIAAESKKQRMNE